MFGLEKYLIGRKWLCNIIIGIFEEGIKAINAIDHEPPVVNPFQQFAPTGVINEPTNE